MNPRYSIRIRWLLAIPLPPQRRGHVHALRPEATAMTWTDIAIISFVIILIIAIKWEDCP
jgi:hypothetical protein